MAAWYAPLVLPQPLAPLPNDYQSKIPHYPAREPTTAQHHVDMIEDSFDYMEIADESIKMRIFAQSLGGEVKKWFKGLSPNSIHDLPSLYQTFINKWEVKANPLQILAEYKNLRRNMGESVHDYSTRFNSIYDALPPNMKPPQGLALIKYPEGFDADMAYQLRERDYNTLEDMQKGAVSVEANLIENKARMKTERRVTYRDDIVASTSDYDRLSKNMEELQQMVKKVVVTVSNQNRNQNQNQNFRRNNNIPNRQRESDHQIIPPFQENFLDEDGAIIEESKGNVINMFETEDSVLNCVSDEDLPSSPYWNKEQLEIEDYRAKTLLRLKILRSPSRKNLRDLLKPLLGVTKQQLRVLRKAKKRTTKALKNQTKHLAALALQLVFLIKQFPTVYIVRISKLTQLLAQ